MGGSNTSIVTQTKQNRATIGLSVVVFGLPWGPLWPWVSDMLILYLDEVAENKTPSCMRLFSWNGLILAL